MNETKAYSNKPAKENTVVVEVTVAKDFLCIVAKLLNKWL